MDYRDIAILFRSVRTSAEPYIRAFKEHGIQYIVKGGGKLFEQDEVKLAVKSIAYLGDYDFGEEDNTAESIINLYDSCFEGWGKSDKFIEKLDMLKEELGHFKLYGGN